MECLGHRPAPSAVPSHTGLLLRPCKGRRRYNHLLAWRLPARMGRDKGCTETHCPWLTGFVFPASGMYGPLGVVLRNWYTWSRSSPFRAAGSPRAPRNPRGSSPFRTGRKSKCVLARLTRAASGRHARRSPFACCARRIPARRVSPLFVNGLMKSRTNVEPKWWRQRGSNPQSCLPSRAPSGRVYSESHGAERYISATFLARPNPLCKCGKLRSSCLPLPPYPTRPTRCTGRALAFVAHGQSRRSFGRPME